jgi:phosphatidylglycerophosphate synthase
MVKHPPLETHPVIEVVADDVILPMIESTVIERTKEQYYKMGIEQQRDFKLAMLSTVGGVALTSAAYILEKKQPEGSMPTILRGAGYALDYVDGYWAKRTVTPTNNGAVTELGAIIDPLADKFNNSLNEIALVQQNKLHPLDLALRAFRDVSVTATRRHVTKHSQGKIDIKANRFGKLNTVIRDSVNLFASTKFADNHPKNL